MSMLVARSGPPFAGRTCESTWLPARRRGRGRGSHASRSPAPPDRFPSRPGPRLRRRRSKSRCRKSYRRWSGCGRPGQRRPPRQASSDNSDARRRLALLPASLAGAALGLGDGETVAAAEDHLVAGKQRYVDIARHLIAFKLLFADRNLEVLDL